MEVSGTAEASTTELLSKATTVQLIWLNVFATSIYLDANDAVTLFKLEALLCECLTDSKLFPALIVNHMHHNTAYEG